MNQTKQAAGHLGGLATLAKHGKAHFSTIGRRGAAELWRRYHLTPAGLRGWALVDRETGKVRATWQS